MLTPVETVITDLRDLQEFLRYHHGEIGWVHLIDRMVARLETVGTVRCDRCLRYIANSKPPDGPMTAGYYVAAAWSRFCAPGEQYVCDQCMWSNPEYERVYGKRA